MLRLHYLGALLGIAALLTTPSSAQKNALTSAQSASPSGARVQHVLVRGSGAAMEVEIQTSGNPLAPDTQAIAGPDRIVVDFPGALPAAELHALEVNRGALKRIRAGLFFNDPPITRIVLDLAEPQSYRISTMPNAVVIKLGEANGGNQSQVSLNPVTQRPADARSQTAYVPPAQAARLQNALLPAGTKVTTAQVSAVVTRTPASRMVSQATTAPIPAGVNGTLAPLPPPPPVTVTYTDGMLRIRAQRATLAEVLYEVQRQTQAEIAIPAGAEQERVVADLGPAPARDVLGALLNGSHYNFVFVGNELALERVILTLRDPNNF